MQRSALLAALFAASACVAQTPAASDTYAVDNTILHIMQFPKSDASIVISAKTQNRNCGPDSGNPTLINGCGIIVPPQTADTIHQALTSGMPALTDETWYGFLMATSTSDALQDAFVTPWNHRLVELQGAPNKSGPTDGAIFLSNVGFNAAGTQALVYVLFVSYIPGLPTSADLWLLERKSPTAWNILSRENLFKTAPKT